MIDYIKVVVKDQQLAGILLSNLHTLFDSFRRRIIENGGGSTYKTIFATYRGLSFKITESGAIIIEGSLHKYRNAGQHNYDEFSHSSLVHVILDLCARFKIDPARAHVHNLEIGVNVRTTFDPTHFTDRCNYLFSNGGVIKPSPITKNDCKGFDNGIRFELNEYCLKVYNKGKQYDCVDNILRIEYKTKKARIIEAVGIRTLEDLCDHEKLKTLASEYLQKTYNQIFVDEIINPKHLTSPQRKLYHRRLNYADTWKNVSRTQRKRNRDGLQKIYNLYASSDIKSIVSDLIGAKIETLLVSEGATLKTSMANAA